MIFPGNWASCILNMFYLCLNTFFSFPKAVNDKQPWSLYVVQITNKVDKWNKLSKWKEVYYEMNT